MTKILDFKFHQLVKTPNGTGVVQGIIREKDKPDRIVVSHVPGKGEYKSPGSGSTDKPLMPHRGGPWVLFAYDPEELEKYP